MGTIAQDALIVADLTAETFDGIIQATRTAALTAYYHSQYDAVSLWQMIDRVNDDRGTEFHRDCVLNDLNGAAVQVQTGRVGSLPEKGDAANAMRDTRLVWTDTDPRPLLFYFEVFRLTRHDVSLSVWADQSRFPAAEVEDFLLAVERLLVAADRRDVPALRYRRTGRHKASAPRRVLAADRLMLGRDARRPATPRRRGRFGAGYRCRSGLLAPVMSPALERLRRLWPTLRRPVT